MAGLCNHFFFAHRTGDRGWTFCSTDSEIIVIQFKTCITFLKNSAVHHLNRRVTGKGHSCCIQGAKHPYITLQLSRTNLSDFMLSYIHHHHHLHWIHINHTILICKQLKTRIQKFMTSWHLFSLQKEKKSRCGFPVPIWWPFLLNCGNLCCAAGHMTFNGAIDYDYQVEYRHAIYSPHTQTSFGYNT